LPDRCYWTRDEDGLEVLIPRCWGSVLDPAGCSCEVEGSVLEKAERRRDIAEGEVLRLREKLIRATDRYDGALRWQRRQYQEIKRLEALVASLEGSKS